MQVMRTARACSVSFCGEPGSGSLRSPAPSRLGGVLAALFVSGAYPELADWPNSGQAILTKAFGGVRAIDDVSLVFPSGSLSAVIGPNGAGKTTFFNPISGAFSTDAGQVLLDGQDAVRCSKAERMHRGIGRAFQVASCFSTMTVADNLMASLPMSAAGAISRAAFLRPASASAPKR